MKGTSKLILLILLGAAAYWAPISKAAGLPVVKDFTLEAKISLEKQAPILVLFMSNSCIYCKQVLQDFLLPMQGNPEYDSRVILRQVETSSRDKLIDFDGKITTQSELANKHHARAVPTIVLFDSHGQELTRIVGLLTVDFYLAYLDSSISESQEKIKAAAK